MSRFNRGDYFSYSQAEKSKSILSPITKSPTSFKRYERELQNPGHPRTYHHVGTTERGRTATPGRALWEAPQPRSSPTRTEPRHVGVDNDARYSGASRSSTGGDSEMRHSGPRRFTVDLLADIPGVSYQGGLTPDISPQFNFNAKERIKTDTLTPEEMSELMIRFEHFMKSVYGFCQRAVPNVQFPDVLEPFSISSSVVKMRNNLLARLDVMEKIIALAEHKVPSSSIVRSCSDRRIFNLGTNSPAASMNSRKTITIDSRNNSDKTITIDSRNNSNKTNSIQTAMTTQTTSFFPGSNIPLGRHTQTSLEPVGRRTRETHRFMEDRSRVTSRSCSEPRPILWGQMRTSVPPADPKAQNPATVWAKFSALSNLRQGTAEQKLRDWLCSVPIGEGASRGWDEKQIEEISQFATSRRLEHLSAEGIYSKYVDHQIEKANEF